MQLYMSWYIISFFGFIFTSYIFFIFFSSTPPLTSDIDIVFVLSISMKLKWFDVIISATYYYPKRCVALSFSQTCHHRPWLLFSWWSMPLMFLHLIQCAIFTVGNYSDVICMSWRLKSSVRINSLVRITLFKENIAASHNWSIENEICL